MPRTRPFFLGVGLVLILCFGATSTGVAAPTTLNPATAPSIPTTTLASGTGALTITTGLQYYRHSPTFDVYRPTGISGPLPALVMVHGGGWRGSDGNQLVPFAEKAALEQHWAVFSVNYRLDDTDPVAWADELHDVQAAIRAIVANADTWNIDPRGVLLLGDSAGANLVALVASVGTVNPVKGASVGGAQDLKVQIRAAAEWSPPTDLRQLVPDNGTAPAACSGDLACDFAWNSPSIVDYMGCTPNACPLAYANASPITWVSKNVAPSYVAGATNELVPVAQIQGYADKLTAAGVPTEFVLVDSTQHATQLGPWLWPSTSAFFGTYLPKPATPPKGAHWWRYPVIGVISGGGSVAFLGLIKRRRTTKSKTR